MKIGPNDILRGHFGHFLPFICPEVPEKVPQMPQNYSIYLGGHPGILEKMRKKCGKMRKNAENAEKCGKMQKNADRNFPPPLHCVIMTTNLYQLRIRMPSNK